MWEQLKAPIVPLIIFGAYDLYPVGSWVNRTGIVTVRYLPPILAEEGLSRDDMLIKVSFMVSNDITLSSPFLYFFCQLRRQMLLSLADCPETVGKDISFSFWIMGVLGNICSIILNLGLLYYFYDLFVFKKQMSAASIACWFGGVTVFITAALYIYYVYLVDLGNKPSKKK
jgi:hypothetical protein